MLLGCDVASVVPRQLAKEAPALELRLGTRCLFPPQCTCSLRCARAPLGGAQGLFYKKETIQRTSTNGNGTKRNKTRLKRKSDRRRPDLKGVFNLPSRYFSTQLTFAEVLGSELLLVCLSFSPFQGRVLARFFLAQLFELGYQNGAKECIV